MPLWFELVTECVDSYTSLFGFDGGLRCCWSGIQAAVKMSGRPSESGCEEPAGGWKVGRSKREFRDQVVEYLSARNYPGVDRVAKAFDRF